MTHSLENMEFLDPGLLQRTVAVTDGNLHAVLQLTAVYTTHGDTALVTGIVERRDEHLRCSLNLLRGRDYLDNLIEQIGNIVGRILPVLTHPTVLCGAIDHGEVQLLFGGVQ